MENILEVLKKIIVDSEIAAGSMIKLNRVPDGDEDVIVISDTGEVAPDPNDTSSLEAQDRTFQIYIRSERYTDGVDYGRQLRELFYLNQDLKSYGRFFGMITMISGFQPIGQDDRSRNEFTGNFRIKVIEGVAYEP